MQATHTNTNNQIFIKPALNIPNTNGMIIPIDVEPTTKIINIKQRIKDEISMPTHIFNV